MARYPQDVIEALTAGLETAERERDEAIARAQQAERQTAQVIDHALSLISHLCHVHLAQARAISFTEFVEQEAIKTCEMCLLQRAESAERDLRKLGGALDQAENRAEAAEAVLDVYRTWIREVRRSYGAGIPLELWQRGYDALSAAGEFDFNKKD